MASDSDSNQTNFFIERHKLDTAPPQFAEISTALYERELAVIASGSLQDANRLKQKLRGLPHHVKRAAHYMSGKYSPLTVDSHNASWLDKQPVSVRLTKPGPRTTRNGLRSMRPMVWWCVWRSVSLISKPLNWTRSTVLMRTMAAYM